MKLLSAVVLAITAVFASAADTTATTAVTGWKKYAEEAIKHAQKGEIDEAIASCQKSLAEEEHYTPHHLLSQMYMAKNEHVKALDEIEKAYKLEPTNKVLKSSVEFHKGVIEQVANRKTEARAFFDKAAAELDRANVKELEKLAIAFASLGDIPTTITYLREIWKLEPHHVFHNGLPMVKVMDLYEEMASLAELEGGKDALAKMNKDLANTTAITNKIFFDVAVGSGSTKRVVVGLYGLAAPRAVANLIGMASCKSEEFCYKNSKLHRVVKDFIVQGGDVAKGDGTGIRNIYNRPYSDDIFALTLMHDRPGVVQIANAGPNQNGGQFVFMVGAAPHLNGKSVIAGHILEGLEHVTDINKVEADKDTGKPNVDVIVKDCGVLN